MRLEAKRCTIARFTPKHCLVRLAADLPGGVALASAQHDKLLECTRYARRAVRSVHYPLRSVEPPMSELEIHTEHHPLDPFGHRVAIFVGIIGVVLVLVTILAHREHTAAVVHKTEANDQWNIYEAKKIKKDNEEIAATLLTSLASDPAKVAAQIDKIHADAARYEKDSDTVKDEAQKREAESLHSEARRCWLRTMRMCGANRWRATLPLSAMPC